VSVPATNDLASACARWHSRGVLAPSSSVRAIDATLSAMPSPTLRVMVRGDVGTLNERAIPLRRRLCNQPPTRQSFVADDCHAHQLRHERGLPG
jgi:hypothetical protein